MCTGTTEQQISLGAQSFHNRLSTVRTAGFWPREICHSLPPIAHIPGELAFLEQPQVPGLGVSDLAQILDWSIQRSMLHPRLCRALVAEILEKATCTAAQVVRVFGLAFAYLGEKALERIGQAT
jgi:hypothetical protein